MQNDTTRLADEIAESGQLARREEAIEEIPEHPHGQYGGASRQPKKRQSTKVVPVDNRHNAVV